MHEQYGFKTPDEKTFDAWITNSYVYLILNVIVQFIQFSLSHVHQQRIPFSVFSKYLLLFFHS
jgi:hypothetical protein